MSTHFADTESYHSILDDSRELDLARKIINLVLENKGLVIHRDLIQAKWSRQQESDKKTEYWNDFRAAEARMSTILNELMELAEQYQEMIAGEKVAEKDLDE